MDEKKVREAIDFIKALIVVGNGDKRLHTAIEALEKQLPKKVFYEGDGYADGELVLDTWICPCCGTMYEVDYDRYFYCPNCGQKIKRAEWGK